LRWLIANNTLKKSSLASERERWAVSSFCVSIGSEPPRTLEIINNKHIIIIKQLKLKCQDY
jgi:hypothetical protein